MILSEVFVRNLIIKCIGDVTGENYEEFLNASATDVIELEKRDYMEVILRIEAILDCTLDMLKSDICKIDVQKLTKNIIEIFKN